MKTIKAKCEIIRPECTEEARLEFLKSIEYVARKCYKSEDLSAPGSAAKMVRRLCRDGHEAMLEHAPTISVCFYVDRGVTHEVVRHRLSSFAQESTRYCNYSKDKFDNGITYVDIKNGIELCPITSKLGDLQKGLIIQEWMTACVQAEEHYLRMLELGASPQIARSVLNHSTKSELVMTANVREWRHFFNLRAAGITGRPHPQMLEVTGALLNTMKEFLPEIFGDIEVCCDV